MKRARRGEGSWGTFVVPIPELVVTIVAGGFVALVLDEDVAIVTWIIGALLTFHEARREARLTDKLERIDKLSEAFDLSNTCDVEALNNLIRSYLAIPEPEFARVKDGVIASARDELLRLSNEKSSGELPSGEYYSWLLPMLDAAQPGTTIRALSMMMEVEWDDSEPERRFIEKNREAAERGVSVERVFVSTPQVLLQAMRDVEAVRLHTSDTAPELLRGYFVDRAYLERSDSSLVKKLGSGFIDLNGRVALVDLHGEDGVARGEVTMKGARLEQIGDIHAQLMLHARPLTHEVLSDEGGAAALDSPAASI